MSHTLLATTGASPQVITETLYAIHSEKLQWPDDIFLITTSFGKKKAIEGLLDKQRLQCLCAELQRPVPAFDATHVLVTPSADGSEVEDARSLQDHEALADFSMTQVRDRTSNKDNTLHASLAGGRKTMTFYIGYAMSLFGRKEDILSHVLVSEGYEGQPDFWYPTNESCILQNGKEASHAEVTLAPIPFIRHRHDLPSVLLQNSEMVKFANLVRLINLGETPEALRLIVDLQKEVIQLQDNSDQFSIDFKPGLLELAFYCMMARATRDEDKDLKRPSKNEKDTGFSVYIINELLLKLGMKPEENSKATINKLRNADSGIYDKSLESLEKGINQVWFQDRITHLRETFERKLPASLLRWILPSIIWSENGDRLPQSDVDKTSKRGGYGINLNRDQIIIKPDLPST